MNKNKRTERNVVGHLGVQCSGFLLFIYIILFNFLNLQYIDKYFLFYLYNYMRNQKINLTKTAGSTTWRNCTEWVCF